MPATFVCIFAGPSIETARLIATTADQRLVRSVAVELLNDPRYRSTEEESSDSVLAAINEGKRHALRLIAGEEGVER